MFSQGSVATRCRCRGKYDVSLVATGKFTGIKSYSEKNRKSVNIIKGMNEWPIKWHVFMAHGVLMG